jgi:hypothetical protein
LSRTKAHPSNTRQAIESAGELAIGMPLTTTDVPFEMRELARNFASEMMDEEELLYLARTLMLRSWEDDAFVVEIGAYIGQTTVFMAKVLAALDKRVPILSIDPFERTQPDALNPQGVYAAYVRTVACHGVDDVCLPLVAFSEHAAPVVPNRIGLLVIDGAHHYEAVHSDLMLYTNKIVPNGCLFLDDYGPAYPGVVQAADEVFSTASRFEILHRSYFVVAQSRISG